MPTFYPEKGFGEIAEKIAKKIISRGGKINLSENIISVKNLQESRTVESTEVVKSTSSEIRTSKKLSEVFNTVDYIKKIKFPKKIKIMLNKRNIGYDHVVYLDVVYTTCSCFCTKL